MGLKLGDDICCRRASEAAVYNAKVMSIRDNEFVLEMDGESLVEISEGQYMVVAGGDTEHYAEVIGVDGGLLRLKKMWSEKRGYFRVDDVFGVMAKKVRQDFACGESRLFSGYSIELSDADYSDETISPGLWKILASLNSKLELILQRLRFGCYEPGAENRVVNLSESGIRFTMDERVEIGDIIEIRMLLPTYPPAGILTYGRVVRVNAAADGKHEVALHFLDMEDDVRKELSKYTIKRQRNIIRKQRRRTKSAHRH